MQNFNLNGNKFVIVKQNCFLMRLTSITHIEESYLVFEFGDKWRVFKLDEHPELRNDSLLCYNKQKTTRENPC